MAETSKIKLMKDYKTVLLHGVDYHSSKFINLSRTPPITERLLNGSFIDPEYTSINKVIVFKVSVLRMYGILILCVILLTRSSSDIVTLVE